MKPGLATQFCDFSEGSTGKNKAYPIRYLLDLAASEAEKLKWAANLQRNGDTTEWVRKYSACTEDQLVSIFHRSLQIFNPGRDPYQIYIIETQGTCSVRGILRIVQNKNHAKEKPSYLFFPSSQIRFQEPQVKPLVFSDVFEIARTLKRDPRTYVLNKAQPLPKPVALPPVSVHASAPPAPKPSSGDGVSLQGAYEAVLQLFKSGTEAVTGRGR
jgi:hypothetical protein